MARAILHSWGALATIIVSDSLYGILQLYRILMTLYNSLLHRKRIIMSTMYKTTGILRGVLPVCGLESYWIHRLLLIITV